MMAVLGLETIETPLHVQRTSARLVATLTLPEGQLYLPLWEPEKRSEGRSHPIPGIKRVWR